MTLNDLLEKTIKRRGSAIILLTGLNEHVLQEGALAMFAGNAGNIFNALRNPNTRIAGNGPYATFFNVQSNFGDKVARETLNTTIRGLLREQKTVVFLGTIDEKEHSSVPLAVEVSTDLTLHIQQVSNNLVFAVTRSRVWQSGIQFDLTGNLLPLRAVQE